MTYCISLASPTQGKELKWEWMLPILLRNVAAAWVICGFWDYFLYASPLAPKLHKYKLNEKYPKNSQFVYVRLPPHHTRTHAHVYTHTVLRTELATCSLSLLPILTAPSGVAT